MGEQLIDIHGQNAHHSLNQEAAQRHLLDAFAGILPQAADVKKRYQDWTAAKKALSDAQIQADTLNIERERLEWQFNELSQTEPKHGEWETLSQSHDTLAHAAELLQTAEAIGEAIDGDNGLQRQIYRCQKMLANLQNIEPRFAESLNLFASIEAELGEISSNMRDAAGRADINPNELAVQEERMSELMGMARKYRIEPQELPAKLEDIRQSLDNLNAAADLEALGAAVARCEAEYMEAARVLSDARREAAVRLSSETAAHMQHLAMKGAQFHIELLPVTPNAHGLEQVQYQVSANKGSPLRPLSKTASGGELARISLAIQVVTSQYTRVPTLIFDEVDTGIGGGVAETVGKALRELGKAHQVLAVTHLPQVAACGENHWKVHKHSEGSQTVSEISVLEGNTRTEEIARMLGGATITDTTCSHAAELLEMMTT